MIEAMLIGATLSGVGLLFVGTGRRDRLPPEAWQDGTTSPSLAPTDTEQSALAHALTESDRTTST